MYICAVCIFGRYLYLGGINIRVVCISGLHVYLGGMYIWVVSISGRYTYRGSMYIWGVCISERYVYQSGMYIRAVCISGRYLYLAVFISTQSICYVMVWLTFEIDFQFISWFLDNFSENKKCIFACNPPLCIGEL